MGSGRTKVLTSGSLRQGFYEAITIPARQLRQNAGSDAELYERKCREGGKAAVCALRVRQGTGVGGAQEIRGACLVFITVA